MLLHVTLGAALCALSVANQIDVMFPHYSPPAECGSAGCRAWNSADDKLFFDKAPSSSVCAIPGEVVDKASGPPETASAGPFCYCKDTGKAAYCMPQMGIPEQINLQYAAQDTLVAAFVTYEAAPPTEMAVATLSEQGGGSSEQQLTGVSHWVAFDAVIPPPKGSGKPMGERNWTMHFVKLAGLKPNTKYTYRVKSGSEAGVWSAAFTFRSARAAPDTRLAMYGDMAITRYNAVSNLLADCLSGKIDVISHMGDHCYDLGQADDRRGDAYMNALQPLLSVCPWIPIIGNHESEADGDGDAIAGRYLNQTFGLPYGNPLAKSKSSATSGLGHLLTKGTYLAPGLHGTTPSGSSAYFSVDVGLIHITALSTQSPKGDELAWLTRDLEAANKNRQQVPWIIVTSHYPIFLSTMQATSVNSSASALGWHSEAGEICSDGVCAGTEYMSCEAAGEAEGCATVGEMVEESSNSMGVLFNRYGVDVYDAGHSHLYAVTWPMLGGKAVQKDYNNPQGTVYITEGNGAVPGTGPNSTLGKPPADWGRIHGTGGAYGIFTTTSASTLTYQHVWNNGNGGKGKVMETWEITNATHIQPPLPPAPPPPPPPPPAPPPAPPPPGMSWFCLNNTSFSGNGLGLKGLGLKDVEVSTNSPNVVACQDSCNSEPNCVALRLHGTDKHCHGLVGKRAPTRAEFTKYAKPITPSELYTSCLLVKD